MQRYLIICLLFLIATCVSAKGVVMDDINILISATCRNNPDCRFAGEDIFLDIRIQNNTYGNLAMPLAYLKARGPSMKLTDRKTGNWFDAPTNLADAALSTQFETLAPNETAQLEWVIMPSDLQQLNPVDVDVDADVEISIGFEGKINDRPVIASGVDMLHITGSKKRKKPTPQASTPSVPPGTQGGHPCPQTGWWHTPAKAGSRRYFKEGTVMPEIKGSGYGATFWQWSHDQETPKLQ